MPVRQPGLCRDWRLSAGTGNACDAADTREPSQGARDNSEGQKTEDRPALWRSRSPRPSLEISGRNRAAQSLLRARCFLLAVLVRLPGDTNLIAIRHTV